MARETEESGKKSGREKREKKEEKRGKKKEKGKKRGGKGRERDKKRGKKGEGGKSHCAGKVKKCRVLGFERGVPKLRTRHECAERELVRAGSFKLNVVSARAEEFMPGPLL